MTNFLTSWRILDFMTNIWNNFDVMTNLLTSWQTFWPDDVLLTSWRTFCPHDVFWHHDEHADVRANCLTSWLFKIMTCLWHHNKCLDVITYAMLLTSWLNVVEVFDNMTHVMVCSLLQGEFVVVMTYFMTSFWCPDIFVHHLRNKIFWKRIFDVIDIMIYFWLHNKTYLWRHAQLLYRPDIFVIISGTKYYENVCFDVIDIYHIWLTNLLMSWCVFGCHWRVFDVMTNFLNYVALIDVMTNVLMSWNFLTTWHTFDVLTHDIMTNVLSWWRIFVNISGTKYNVNVIPIL